MLPISVNHSLQSHICFRLHGNRCWLFVKHTKWVRSEVLLLAVLVRGTFSFQRYRWIYARAHESTNLDARSVRRQQFLLRALILLWPQYGTFFMLLRQLTPRILWRLLGFCKICLLLISLFPSNQKTNYYYYYRQHYYHRRHHGLGYFKCFDFLRSS